MSLASDAAAHPAAFFTGIAIGAAVVGLVVGLIPLAVGALTNQKRLGTTGFISCLVGSLIGGAMFAVPIAVGFCINIVIKSRKKPTTNDAPPPPSPGA